MISRAHVFLSWTRRILPSRPTRDTPTRDAAVAGLPPPERPELLSGSCSGPPRASPRGKWSTAGLRRDPLCHLSAEILPPRSHSLLPVVGSQVIGEKGAVSAALTPRILGTTERSSLCGWPMGYDETPSAEVRGPSVPCQGLIRMTFSLNVIVRPRLREYIPESGASYTPQLRTLDGTIFKLSAVQAAYFHADGLLEQIRHATGLPRLDWPAGSAKRPAERP